MKQEIIKTKIPHIGDIEIKVVSIEDKWWLSQIVQFITLSDERFAVIAFSNPPLKTQVTFQNTLQRFITFIQAGGEPQAANKIRTHFNNWINKQNGTFNSVQRGTQSNGAKVSGTEIIEPDKQYGGRLGRRT